MRRTLAVGILVCFLLSIIPAISDSPIVVESEEAGISDSRLIDDSELTLGQIEALNAAGLARGTNTNWSAAGGSQSNDEIYEMIFDSQGNIIVCGTIYQASQFGAVQVFTEGEGDFLGFQPI